VTGALTALHSHAHVFILLLSDQQHTLIRPDVSGSAPDPHFSLPPVPSAGRPGGVPSVPTWENPADADIPSAAQRLHRCLSDSNPGQRLPLTAEGAAPRAKGRISYCGEGGFYNRLQSGSKQQGGPGVGSSASVAAMGGGAAVADFSLEAGGQAWAGHVMSSIEDVRSYLHALARAPVNVLHKGASDRRLQQQGWGSSPSFQDNLGLRTPPGMGLAGWGSQGGPRHASFH